MTYLAVPIQVESPEQALPIMRQAVKGGADMLELRLDYLLKSSREAVRTVVVSALKLGRPVIATCRPVWEGGHYQGEEEARRELLREAATRGATYVDVELEAWAGKTLEGLGEGKVKVIVSSHDFEKRPENWQEITDRLEQSGGDIRKIAYGGQSINDVWAALDWLHEVERAENMIALMMGEAGLMSRLLAKKMGAFLTFASAGVGQESAPGQMTLQACKNVYGWERLNRLTQVYGVIGCPVGHSMGPMVHNAAFAAKEFDGIYLPLLVEEGALADFLDGLRKRDWLGARGFSVTIPHKEAALRYVRERGGELEPLAERIGAVNTVIFDEEGEVAGYNTDYAGALDAIVEGLAGERTDLKGTAAAVVGAGGVARALVAGLTDAEAVVTIYNRTEAKAKALAEEFDCRWAGLEALKGSEATLIVNCTSVGMFPDVKRCPVPVNLLGEGKVVFDTVYTPMETRLLREAQKRGAKTVDGVSMFVNQAAAQFRLFTGQEAPTELMRQVVEQQVARSSG